MSVNDAELDDIYVDDQGKLWRCVALCKEPTVTFEEVEGRVSYTAAAQNTFSPPIHKDQKCGSVYGAMWDDWKRIWRKG